MKNALITGANKSIGFETARFLLKNGFHVFLGARDESRGREAGERLTAEGLTDFEVIQLDVSDQVSVDAARATIGNRVEVLDALINNAGISGGMPQSAMSVTIEQFRRVMEVNLYGIVRMNQAFLDLLEKSAAPRIVMVSSLGASMTLHSDPSWKYYAHKAAVYPTSKAAVNMYTIDLAYELRDTAFRVNAVDPGFTKTDFNHHRGTGSVEEAGRRIGKYALTEVNMPSGKFISEEQNPINGEIPW